MPHEGPINTAAHNLGIAIMAAVVGCNNAVPAAQEMPRSGIIEGVSSDVNMPLSVSPRLA